MPNPLPQVKIAMQLLFELFYNHPFLSLVQTAFTIWMLVDSYRRGADGYWFWVILWLQPLGAWVYFFAVKARDLRRGVSLPSRQRRPSLDELRYRVQQTPTLIGHLTLADRLVERDGHAEAVPHLEAALAREPDHSQALYCLAICFMRQGEPNRAVPLLEKVVARDRAWSDYQAWRLLVDAHADCGDGPGALAACRDLARLSPTLRHRCLLASRLEKEGQAPEARDMLEQALQEHRFAPAPIRRRNRRWAAEASRLLKALLLEQVARR